MDIYEQEPVAYYYQLACALGDKGFTYYSSVHYDFATDVYDMRSASMDDAAQDHVVALRAHSN